MNNVLRYLCGVMVAVAALLMPSSCGDTADPALLLEQEPALADDVPPPASSQIENGTVFYRKAAVSVTH